MPLIGSELSFKQCPNALYVNLAGGLRGCSAELQLNWKQ